MVENLAQQTANQIVDKIASTDQDKTEAAFGLLAANLHKEAYPGEPSSQAGAHFVAEVFSDINAQYTNGKTVPSGLALAWAKNQTGHELPATGFSRSDLESVKTSSDPSVNVLDKYMAGVLLNDYSALQDASEKAAINRLIANHECSDEKKIIADYRVKSGIPVGGEVPPYFAHMENCNDKEAPGDRTLAAGVVRQISVDEVQDKLKMLDAANPTYLWF
jgi:hypothetical protein